MPDTIGYVAAAVSCLAFGSFAVPIKAPATRGIAVDPLVLQTYKIGVCFVTSWLVLAFGVRFSFTPWGLVSGLFMAPGGSAGYFAVRNAGLAVSQGIWSSLKVLVAFGWGVFVFHEPVRSMIGSSSAVVLMLVGLIGMSCMAAPSSNKASLVTAESQLSLDQERPLLDAADDDSDEAPCCRCPAIQYRHLGLLGAVIDGAYGGSVLVPMHYAGPQATQGLDYLLSFAIGCASVVGVLWVLRFSLASLHARSLATGYECMPSFHWTTIGPYAIGAGLIWSIGNASAILSVSLLGQGVGYSIVQSQLLVAGLWGIFYYKEIVGARVVAWWFGFACLTVAGMILLSQQHVAAAASAKS